MNHESVQGFEDQGAVESASGAAQALQMIVDPAAALDAARRMEMNCRSGIRFFSDFRRVRPLDSMETEEVDHDAELVDDGYPRFDQYFDAGCVRVM